MLRSAIEAHGGWLFKHTGDGVCAAFTSACRGCTAAVEAQRHRRSVDGSRDRRGGGARDDYLGPVLNRVARVMAAGHGQILVAGSTALLRAPDLLDLGEHRLRDLSGTERLYQVVADGLGDTFPPLRTMDTTPGNVTQPATSFVGRGRGREVAGLLRAHRLVTLTGVGSVGKTRLALQVAAGWWRTSRRDLAGRAGPVGDGQAVPEAVAGVLGVTTSRARRRPTRSHARSAGVGCCSWWTTASTCSTPPPTLSRPSLPHDDDHGAGDLAGGPAGQRRAGAAGPLLGTDEGPGSAAVQLFVERARSVNPRSSWATRPPRRR